MRFKDKAKSMNSGNGIAFMENRDKGNVNDLLDKVVTVNDYDFIHGEEGDYIVFTVKEDDENFYFGASVMTEDFKEFTRDEKDEIKREGCPIKLWKQKNKKGNREYQAIEFFPDGDSVKK